MALGLSRDIEDKVNAMLNGENPDWASEQRWRQSMRDGTNADWNEFMSRMNDLTHAGPETLRQSAKNQLGAELNLGTHAGIMPLFNNEAINGLEGDSSSSEGEDDEEP